MSDSAPKITVVHATAPGCHWSWGYEAVVNRLRMVYGDQIDLHIRIGCPYEDWDQWLVDYGMSEDEAIAWMNDEVAPLMGVPLGKVKKGGAPKNVMPATLALVAARHQPDKADRFGRALVRMFALEGKDPSKPDVIEAAAKEAKLDLAKFNATMKDQAALKEEYENQQGPPVHVGFYNFAVWDGGNRKVLIDYEFNPEAIEGAIEYLSEGKLKKNKPTDIVGYLKHHGLAPLSEVGRVFDMDGPQATAALETLEKEHKIERQTISGAPLWKAIG